MSLALERQRRTVSSLMAACPPSRRPGWLWFLSMAPILRRSRGPTHAHAGACSTDARGSAELNSLSGTVSVGGWVTPAREICSEGQLGCEPEPPFPAAARQLPGQVQRRADNPECGAAGRPDSSRISQMRRGRETERLAPKI